MQVIQRNENINVNIQFNNETESGMKQTMASIEIQDEITRADEFRELLEARVGENKSTISRVNKDIKTIETSTEDFNK